MSNPFIAGTAYLSVDGKSVMLVGEFTYRPNSSTNESLKGMDGVHGVKKTPEPGQIKAKLRDNGSISVQQISDAVDVSVVAELANGKTVIGRNMWRVGDPLEVDTDDSTFVATWEGADVRES